MGQRDGRGNVENAGETTVRGLRHRPNASGTFVWQFEEREFGEFLAD